MRKPRIVLTPETHRSLKLLAVSRGTSLESLTERIIVAYLKRCAGTS
jgi:hypothetical protein